MEKGLSSFIFISHEQTCFCVCEWISHTTELTIQPPLYLFFAFSFRPIAEPQRFWLTSYIFFPRTVILLPSFTHSLCPPQRSSATPPTTGQFLSKDGLKYTYSPFSNKIENHGFSSKIYVSSPKYVQSDLLKHSTVHIKSTSKNVVESLYLPTFYVPLH